MSKKTVTIKQKFMSKVSKKNGCWIWIGSVSKKGYPQICIRGRMKPAHRIAYERMVGPTPKNSSVVRTCNTSLCVRPGHLALSGGSVHARFFSKVDKEGLIQPNMSTPCWLWTSPTNHRGYGMFWYNRRDVSAHRMSWLLHHEDAIDMLVLHKCDVRHCVNPDHLFLGTQKDNVQDCIDKGRRFKSKKPEEERYWDMVDKKGPDNCWAWLGSKKMDFRTKSGKKVRARRFTYAKFIGEIPDRMVVMASCQNLICMNPSHLILGSLSDASRLGHRRTWIQKRKNAEPKNPELLEKEDIIYSVQIPPSLMMRIRKDNDGCWTWTGSVSSTRGIPIIKRKGKTINIRRILWKKTRKEDPGSSYVIATCGNSLCVSPKHINKVSRGSVSKPKSKVSPEDVKAIRAYYEGGVFSQRKLSKRYGISNQQISDIVNFKCWKDVQ